MEGKTTNQQQQARKEWILRTLEMAGIVPDDDFINSDDFEARLKQMGHEAEWNTFDPSVDGQFLTDLEEIFGRYEESKVDAD